MNDADLRIRAPRTMFRQDPTLNPRLGVTRKGAGDLDARLPPHGSCLEREYKGRRIIVKVLVDGFAFECLLCRSAIPAEIADDKICWRRRKRGVRACLEHFRQSVTGRRSADSAFFKRAHLAACSNSHSVRQGEVSR